jgi:hypothetical protein
MVGGAIYIYPALMAHEFRARGDRVADAASGDTAAFIPGSAA